MTERPVIRLSFGETSHVIEPDDLADIKKYVIENIHAKKFSDVELMRQVNSLAKPIHEILKLAHEFENEFPRKTISIPPVITEEDFKEDGGEIQNGLLMAFKTPFIQGDVKMFTAPAAVELDDTRFPKYSVRVYDALKWPPYVREWFRAQRLTITRLYMKGSAGVEIVNVFIESTEPVERNSAVDMNFNLDTPTLKVQGDLTHYGRLDLILGHDSETTQELIGVELIATGWI